MVPPYNIVFFIQSSGTFSGTVQRNFPSFCSRLQKSDAESMLSRFLASPSRCAGLNGCPDWHRSVELKFDSLVYSTSIGGISGAALGFSSVRQRRREGVVGTDAQRQLALIGGASTLAPPCGGNLGVWMQLGQTVINPPRWRYKSLASTCVNWWHRRGCTTSSTVRKRRRECAVEKDAQRQLGSIGFMITLNLLLYREIRPKNDIARQRPG